MSDVTPLETPPNDNKRFQTWQVIFALNTSTQNLADEHTVADGPPSELSIDALNTDNGFFKKRWEFPLIFE